MLGELQAQQADRGLGEDPVAQVVPPDFFEQHHLGYIGVVPLGEPIVLKQKKHRKIHIKKEHRLLNTILLSIKENLLVHLKRQRSYHEEAKRNEPTDQNGPPMYRKIRGIINI